jgi:NAD(P)-dependent dehydrogenase (short-subunit alcohol dehydrogenase family)
VLAAQLANEKGGPIALQADSGGAFQVKAAVDQTLTGFGRLDTLVVNASIPRLARIDHHNRQQCRCPCRLSSVYAMRKTAVAGW